MKSKMLVGMMCLLTVQTGFGQRIQFKETSHHFGLIQERDGDVSYDFLFTNVGNKPLVIEKVITGCGCTSAQWSKKVYQPGDKGVVQISYHPEGRKMKHFSIPSEVFTNQRHPATLTVTGEVSLEEQQPLGVFDVSKGRKARVKPMVPNDDFEWILQRLREQIFQQVQTGKVEQNAVRLVHGLDEKGRWADLDYHCFFRTNWEPLEHVNRIKKLALAYTYPKSDLYGNKVLYKAITKAAETWQVLKPTSYNWWFNQIAVPRAMADVLALMDAGVEKFPPALLKGWLIQMDKGDARNWTGANKMDIAAHHIVRGCLLKNDSIVHVNRDEFFQPICITDQEGIQKDLSYQQHGKQLYIGGYGIVFVDNVVSMAPLLMHTKYALDQEQLELFSSFIRKSYLNVFRARYMDFSVCGRSVSRKNILDVKENQRILNWMKTLDAKHAEVYEAADQRRRTDHAELGREEGNCMFYRSDFMLHNRKKYDFSIRAVSNRTCRSESGNGENLLGTFLSEGATNIRVKGDEYFNIFPVWEWDKIPGTTTPAQEIKNLNEWGVLGKAEFVGGVSDSLYGVMAYAMDDYDSKAKKGWFLFDQEVVCLGAGIASTSEHMIHTSVNQCHLVNEVYQSQQGIMKEVAKGQHRYHDFSGRLWHNDVGYLFPYQTQLVVKNDYQEGKWSKINFNQSGQLVSLPIFNVWIEHGKQPQDESYCYIVVPGVSSPEEMTAYDASAVKIVRNTKELQAVFHSQLDIIQMIFYQSGELSYDGYTVKASQPCVAMITNLHSNAQKVYVTDPTQKGKPTISISKE